MIEAPEALEGREAGPAPEGAEVAAVETPAPESVVEVESVAAPVERAPEAAVAPVDAEGLAEAERRG